MTKTRRKVWVDDHTERLFTYGTLQMSQVQEHVWGEVFDEGEKATLEGYGRENSIAIAPDSNRSVEGVIYHLTPEQLRRTDNYEGSGYIRTKCLFKDKEAAWVYVPSSRFLHLIT